MRNRGTRFEFLRTRPHDHLGWAFAGRAEFSALAMSFLAEGVARGELVIYVADDPDPVVTSRLSHLAGPDAVQVASITEIYGDSGIVEPEEQRVTFEAICANALADGFSGIRVAADASRMVLDPWRLAAWRRWEVVADRFITEHPATALCAFDTERLGPDLLSKLATSHPLTSATSPVPGYRIYWDDGALRIDGEPGYPAIGDVRLALAEFPAGTPVVVDLAQARTVGDAVLRGLRALAGSDVPVTIRGSRALIGQLRASGATGPLTLEADQPMSAPD